MDNQNDKPANPGRRRLLARLGLAAGMAYVAPVMLHLNAAHASGASGAGSGPSGGRSGPSGGGRGGRSGPSGGKRGGRSGPSGGGRSSGSRPSSGRADGSRPGNRAGASRGDGWVNGRASTRGNTSRPGSYQPRR